MALTTAQFAEDVAALLVAQGVALDDATAFATTFATKLTGWLGGEDAIPADLAQRLTALISLWHAEMMQWIDWWAGTTTGGPNEDGLYPIVNPSDPDGDPLLIPCLAKIQESMERGDPAGVSFTFAASTADGDPGAGKLRLNHATPASASFAYIDLTEVGGADITAWLDSFDASTSTAKGQLYLQEFGAPIMAIYRVTGAVVDATGYRKLPLAHIASTGSFTADAKVSVVFVPKGDMGQGDVDGPTGATDGHAAVFDGTTGKAIRSAGFAPENAALKGVAGGYAGLDGGGKVPAAQLPSAVLGGLNYQGAWDAAANSPTLPAASSANKGWFYKVATAGTTNLDGITDWQVGDWAVSSGTAWEKVDNTDQVSSVVGLTGAITGEALKAAMALAKADVGLENVDNTADADKPISTATQTALDALGVLYLASVGLTLSLTEFEVAYGSRVLSEDDANKLLFFTNDELAICYVDSLPENFVCGVLMAGEAPVQVRPGLERAEAPGGLLAITQRYRFGVIRRLTSTLSVFHGGDAVLPSGGIDRALFDDPAASGLAALLLL
jgi:hypothetical protein